jgi:hypothetical protein
MKINEVITEDVDMGWWKDIDAQYNPEALKFINKQEDRAAILNKGESTPVFSKPVRGTQDPFSTKPPKDAPQSAGFVGNVEVRTRAKHISPEQAEKITDISLPRSPRLPG